ncbi:MAG: hypothetical protein AB7H66_07765 [Hyphomonadaceae bacterium]
MPVVLRHNAQLEMNLAEYLGPVTFAELEGVAAFLAQNSSFLKHDCLSVVLPGADFQGVPFIALDHLFGRYKIMFAPIDFQIVRRSAWLCLSPAAQPHIDYWIGERDTREAMSSTLRQFTSYADAGDWLVLSAAETAMLERGEDFAELARFDAAHVATGSKSRHEASPLAMTRSSGRSSS